jgi:hypothetical protein
MKIENRSSTVGTGAMARRPERITLSPIQGHRVGLEKARKTYP